MSVMPRTLAGRLLLIILTGLVVALLASVALFDVERGRAVERFAAVDLATRIVESARGLVAPAAAPPAATSPAAPASPAAPGTRPMRPRLRLQQVDSVGEAPAAGEAPPPIFESELRRLLTESFGADPVVWISTREWHRPEGAMPPPGGRTGRLVTVALRMPGGQPVRVESALFLPALQIPTEAWVSVALLFVVTGIFSIWAVRLAVQPVRMLAVAAERLSRNIDEPPLAEEGAVEIRAAARAFNRMQDRLRRHVNSRALAFAAMSHDIRTPLTRLRLRLETVGDDAKAKLADDLAEIETLAKSALEVVRGLSAEEAVVQIDFPALLARLAADFDALGGHFEVSGKCAPIEGRPAALRRAVANLVDNGLKYGKKVRVEIEDFRDRVSIRVCDSGPGIPADHINKVVYPFYRIERSRNRETGGTGLGLAIAKDIVEGHGGELTLANMPGGGLCASIGLPR
jgi:signal transduction histidine kinase